MNSSPLTSQPTEIPIETSSENRLPELTIEISTRNPLLRIPASHQQEAARLAREAYVMTLLRHHDISAGRAAALLGIDRWKLSDLMTQHDISPFPDLTQAELEREVAQAKRTLANSQ